MINIPEEVRNLLKEGSVRKNFRVHFPNGERADITNENVIGESVTLTESLCSQNSLTFGLCETPQIEFETFGVENIKGATIECSIEVEQNDGTFYSIPLGKFVVDSCKKQADMTHRQIQAYSPLEFKDLKQYPYVYSALSQSMYLDTTDIFIDPEVLVKLLKFDGVVDEEPVYNTPYTIEPTYEFTYEGVAYVLSVGYRTYFAESGALVGGRVPRSAFALRYEKSQELYDKIASNPIMKYGYDEMRTETTSGFTTLLETIDKAFIGNNTITLRKGSNIFTLGKGRYADIDELSNTVVFPYGVYSSETILADSSCIVEMFAAPHVLTNLTLIKKSDYSVVYSTGVHYDNRIVWKEIGQLIYDESIPWGGLMIKPTSEKKSIKMVNSSTGKNTSQTLYKINFPSLLDESIQDMIQGYIELYGKFGVVDRYGNFEIKSINDNFLPENKETLTPSDYSSLWYEDNNSKKIGRISFDVKEDGQDDPVHYEYDIVDDFNTVDYCTYDISNNFFVKNGGYKNIETFAKIIMAENVKDITYMPMEITIQGRPDIEVGDVFDVVLNDGTHFNGFVEKRTLSGIQALTDSIVSTDEETSIRSGSGSSSSGSRAAEGLKTKVLWENASPSSSFAGQTITLNDDVENYDYIGIICANGSSNADGRSRFMPIVMIPTSSTMGAVITLAAYRNYRRNTTAMSGNFITFGDCVYYATYGTNTGTNSNTNIVPRLVIGFKE